MLFATYLNPVVFWPVIGTKIAIVFYLSLPYEIQLCLFWLESFRAISI